MFSEISRCYDELICKFDLHSVQECVDAFLAINHSRHEQEKELSAKNEFEAYKRAQQLVKDFLTSDDDSNFFAKIEDIRSKTLAEYAERFENKCSNGMKYLTIRKNNLFCCSKNGWLINQSAWEVSETKN